MRATIDFIKKLLYNICIKLRKEIDKMLFERLSDAECEMIQSRIDNFALQSHQTSSASLDYLLRIWERNKEGLYHLFGDQLILEQSMEVSKPPAQLEDDLDEAMDTNDIIRKFIQDFIHCSPDHKFKLNTLIGNRSLVNNTYDGPTFTIKVPEGRDIVVSTGCKASRLIGKIAKAFNLEGYEEFRLAHSMCLNQKKLKGTVCLSIHPLDYITMSDNECNWHSCMSWAEDGCYKQGTVEMMNSPYVVVAYLKSNEDMDIGSYSWSNKKWRQLFIVEDRCIVGVKGYPYCNDELTKICANWLRGLMARGKECFTEPQLFNAFNDAYIEDIGSVYFNPETIQMYNDFGEHHWGCFNKTLVNDGDTVDICYSGPSECMDCGATENDFTSEGALVCAECDDSVQCQLCGDWYNRSEMIEVDGQLICPDCYDEDTREDDLTGEVHMMDNMVRIYFAKNSLKETWKNVYLFTTQDNIDNEYYKDFFSEIHQGYPGIKVVFLDECTEQGLSAFGFSTPESVLEYERTNANWLDIDDCSYPDYNKTKIKKYTWSERPPYWGYDASVWNIPPVEVKVKTPEISSEQIDALSFDYKTLFDSLDKYKAAMKEKDCVIIDSVSQPTGES
jgi:hypothetical protein